MVKLPDNT